MKISKSYSVDVLKYSFIMGCYYNEKRYISVLKHLNIKTLIYCSVSVDLFPRVILSLASKCDKPIL